MAITIGSNISSLKAQRSLDQASRDRSSVFERLSSGLRINRASDDAAGLAVASALNSNVRVYNTAIRNLSDGISFLNIADAAVQNTKAVLFRLKELATQSANGTYADKQRQALDNEAQQLIREYNRILDTTSFNKQQIFSTGSNSSSDLRLQHGYGSAESLNVAISSASVSTTTQTVGTGTFQGVASYNGGDGADTIVSGDVDGDGDTDLVVTGYNEQTINVFMGNGNGTFQARVSYTQGYAEAPSFATLADLNGDQRLDMLYSSIGSVTYRLNSGTGTFGAAVSLNTSHLSAYDIAVGDFNGDSRPEILVGDYTGAEINYFANNGNGTFASEVDIVSGTGHSAIVVGDLNGDSFLDFATQSADDVISVHMGNGNGTFQTRVSYASGLTDNGSGDQQGRSLKLGDVDGDGDLDVVAVNNDSDTLDVHLNNGNGTFGARMSLSLGAVGVDPGAVGLADLNGDSRLDVAYSLFGIDRMVVRFGNGNGTFGAATTLVTGDRPFDIHVADVSGDGVADLMAASQGSDSFQLFITNSTSTQSQVTSTSGLRTLGGISVNTRANALAALSTIDTYFDELNTISGTFGASLARVDLIQNKLRVQVENFQGAASRIMDADIAVESANAVRTEILQRAASAILASANQLPRLALDLLGG